MPELPEVETIARELRSHILYQPITGVVTYTTHLRLPIPPNIKHALIKKSFINIKRRGKYLLLSISDGKTLLVHLGISGQIIILPLSHEKNKHEHIAITFANHKSLCFIDPRKFGTIILITGDPLQHTLLKNLGPEPLSKKFNSTFLRKHIYNRKITIKQLLMDGRFISGIGNIYANEALFLSKINPIKPAYTLTFKECDNLVNAIKATLKRAILKKGTTIKDFRNSFGENGQFQVELKVYGRENKTCLECKKSIIKKIRIAGRGSFYCPKCQQ